MKTVRMALVIVAACLILTAAYGPVFGAMRTVKFQVDGCD